jgi:hypothetical protein
VLGRNPGDDELQWCVDYVADVPSREEAFEDILWALLNTTEFLHNQ